MPVGAIISVYNLQPNVSLAMHLKEKINIESSLIETKMTLGIRSSKINIYLVLAFPSPTFQRILVHFVLQSAIFGL